MARFVLKDKHYLNVPGTKWEQRETSQQTGKQIRVDYDVGLYLDPKDPADWNYPNQIIVATRRSTEHPADIVFIGPPTLDMDPIDDEARELLAKLTYKRDPFADLPGTVDQTFSDRLLQFLEGKLSQVQPLPAPDDRVAKLEAQIAELQKLIQAKPKAVTP